MGSKQKPKQETPPAGPAWTEEQYHPQTGKPLTPNDDEWEPEPDTSA